MIVSHLSNVRTVSVHVGLQSAEKITTAELLAMLSTSLWLILKLATMFVKRMPDGRTRSRHLGRERMYLVISFMTRA